jgi:hypothetical protein
MCWPAPPAVIVHCGQHPPVYPAPVTAWLPLDSLDLVDWHRLTHAYGVADDVPGALSALAAAPPADAARICDGLAASLDHQGVQRFEATLRTVPFLVGLLKDARPGRDHIANLLADLAVGDPNWFLHNGFHPDEATYDDACSRPRSVAEGPDGDRVRRAFPAIGQQPGTGHDMTPGGGLREIYDAVGAGTQVYLDALADEDALVRAAVAHLMAWLTPHAARLAPALAERLASDPAEPVRASAALALSHVAKFDAEVRARAADALTQAWHRGGGDLERRCLALALVRFEDASLGAPVRPALVSRLATGTPAVPAPDRFPWIRIDSDPFLFCTLFLGSPEPERPAVVEAACAGLPGVRDHHDATDLAVWLIRLCVPAPGEDAPLASLREAVLASVRATPAARHYTDVWDELGRRGARPA